MDVWAWSHSSLPAAVGAAIQWLFPSLSFGLACYLVVLEGLWAATRNPAFRALYGLWVQVFGVCLVLGLAAGLLVGRALGWSWNGAEMSAAAAGAAILAAIAIHRRERAGEAGHIVVSVLLAASLSAILLWVVDLNGASHASTVPYHVRLIHTANGAFLTTALAVGAAAAWRLLRRPDEAPSALALRMAVGTLAITAALGVLAGPPNPDVGEGRVGEAGLPVAVGLGVAMICLAIWAGWLAWRRGGPERSRVFLRACLAMGGVSLLAALVGWTSGALSPAGASTYAGPSAPIATLLLGSGYALLFGAGAALIVLLVGRGPGDPFDGTAA